MQGIGSLHPTEGVTVPADTVGSVIGSSVGAVVAQDWPSGAHMVSISGNVGAYFNAYSTAARIPSTNSVGSTAPADRNVWIEKEAIFQRPGGSTGYSFAFPSSGVVTLEFFRK